MLIRRTGKYTQKDSTPSAEDLKNQSILHYNAIGGAESGAVPSPDPLAAFVASLTTAQRAALVRLLTAAPPVG